MAKDLSEFLDSKLKDRIGSMSPVDEEETDPSEEVDEKEVMAEELIQAIKDGDAQAVIESLKALIQNINE